MKQIIVTATLDPEGKIIVEGDTHSGDALNPHEYGQALAAIIKTAGGMVNAVCDAYEAEGKPHCITAVREAFMQCMDQSPEENHYSVTPPKKGRGL